MTLVTILQSSMHKRKLLNGLEEQIEDVNLIIYLLKMAKLQGRHVLFCIINNVDTLVTWHPRRQRQWLQL